MGICNIAVGVEALREHWHTRIVRWLYFEVFWGGRLAWVPLENVDIRCQSSLFKSGSEVSALGVSYRSGSYSVSQTFRTMISRCNVSMYAGNCIGYIGYRYRLSGLDSNCLRSGYLRELQIDFGEVCYACIETVDTFFFPCADNHYRKDQSTRLRRILDAF